MDIERRASFEDGYDAYNTNKHTPHHDEQEGGGQNGGGFNFGSVEERMFLN